MMVLFPLSQQYSQAIKHVFFVFYSIFELALLNLRIFPYTVDYCDFFVDFLSNQPVVL